MGMTRKIQKYIYPIFSTNKVSLIHNEKTNILDILPLLPASRQYVPFIRGTDNDVTLSQELQICACFSS